MQRDAEYSLGIVALLGTADLMVAGAYYGIIQSSPCSARNVSGKTS
jgi:hypothetical protein